MKPVGTVCRALASLTTYRDRHERPFNLEDMLHSTYIYPNLSWGIAWTLNEPVFSSVQLYEAKTKRVAKPNSLISLKA